MVVKVEPVPFMKNAFQYGARTAREEAMLKGMDAIDRQNDMNQKHAGGGKQIIVPQVYTGASSDSQLNKHIASANEALIKHNTNREFDELALSNKIGGRKRKYGGKSKKTKKTKKTKNKKTRRN